MQCVRTLLASCMFWCLLAAVGGAEDDFADRREKLVGKHIVASGVKDQRVVEAIRVTPRHEFVPASMRRRAYRDMALPIGHGQTISSPYIVARMTEQLKPTPTDRVLEIGTGSGYQAAVLSSLVRDVYSIEIVPELGMQAKKTLARLGYENVQLRVGDGFQGWKEHAPFDKIIVTCSPDKIPRPLVEQLKEGGHIVIPVGERFQQILYRFTKRNGKLDKEEIESTFFVPMTGVAEVQRTRSIDEIRPVIVNGGFEERTVSGEPQGWFYLRSGGIIHNPKTPQGIRCLTIVKRDTERAHALQPVGLSGDVVASIELKFWSKGENIQTDLVAVRSAQVIIEFYDQQRGLCGDAAIEVPTGSFPWRENRSIIEVPTDTKLAMIEVGLFGARGKIHFDDVRVEVATQRPESESLREQVPSSLSRNDPVR